MLQSCRNSNVHVCMHVYIVNVCTSTVHVRQLGYEHKCVHVHVYEFRDSCTIENFVEDEVLFSTNQLQRLIVCFSALYFVIRNIDVNIFASFSEKVEKIFGHYSILSLVCFLIIT